MIAGDARHPEVKSVLSYLGNDGMVLQNPFSIEAKKIGVVSQTTLDRETFWEVVRSLMESTKELRIYNTICESTNVRRQEATALAGQVGAMLIVGGRNSSNTTKLYGLVKRIQPRTYHIEAEDEIRPEWFVDVQKSRHSGGSIDP